MAPHAQLDRASVYGTEAANAIAAEAKAEYQRHVAKLAEIEEIMKLTAGSSDEDSKAKAIELYGERR